MRDHDLVLVHRDDLRALIDAACGHGIHLGINGFASLAAAVNGEAATEVIYTEALALPDLLRAAQAECTPYDHELLRWAADELRRVVSGWVAA